MSTKLNLDVLRKAYGWAITDDGEVHGLTAGDMGYESTGIKLDGDALAIWRAGVANWAKPVETTAVSDGSLLAWASRHEECASSSAQTQESRVHELIEETDMATQKHPKPEGYFEEKASDALAASGLVLPEAPTPLESKLMAQLLLVSGAAERVLSDVDDDGVAEAQDMAVLGMRKALLGQRLPKFMPATN